MIDNKIIKSYLPELFYLRFFRKTPNAVTVNLTSRCNQHCIYCEIGKHIETDSSKLLTIDDLKWIIDQMAENKIRILALCGGEPFLFEGITDIVAYAGEKNIRCSVTTNGMTVHQLSEHNFDIFKKFKTQINISVDSFQDSIHAFTRGTPSALTNALKSVKVLQDRFIPVTILSTISDFNYKDLYNSFVMAYEMGIIKVLFQPVIYYSNYPDRQTLDQKAQLNVCAENIDLLIVELEKIKKFEKGHAIETNVYRIIPWISYYLKTASAPNKDFFFNKMLKKFYCRDLYALIDITYNGGIQPCGLSLATTTIHENRQLGLMQQWQNATMKIKNDLAKGRYYPECNGCCHHFSRNMLASVMKYPFQNRNALLIIVPVLLSRTVYSVLKRIKLFFK